MAALLWTRSNVAAMIQFLTPAINRSDESLPAGPTILELAVQVLLC
jgi:hypothetical protein